MSNEVINPYQQFKDDDGDPVENGTLTFFENLTTTLATIFSDEALTIPQTNPYTLDASGRVTGDVKYKGKLTVVLKDQLDAEIRTMDNVTTLQSQIDAWIITGGTPTQTSSTTFTLVGDQTDDFQVGRRLRAQDSAELFGTITDSVFSGGVTTVTVLLDTGSLTGALSQVAVGISSLDREISTSTVNHLDLNLTNAINYQLEYWISDQGLNPKLVGAVFDGVADDSTAINNALAFAKIARVDIVFPAGLSRLDALVSLDTFAGVHIRGAGKRATRFYITDASAGFKFTNCRECSFSGFAIYGTNYEAEFSGQPLSNETVAGVTPPDIAFEISATSGAAINCTQCFIEDIFIITSTRGIKLGNANNVQTSEISLTEVTSFRSSSECFDFEGTNTNNIYMLNCTATTTGAASSSDVRVRSGAGPVTAVQWAAASTNGSKASWFIQTTNSITLISPFAEQLGGAGVSAPFILCEPGITNDKGIAILGGQLSTQQDVPLINYQPTEGYLNIEACELNGQTGGANVTIGSGAIYRDSGVTYDGVTVTKTIANVSDSDASTTATTIEETLHTVNVPANTLRIDGQALKIRAWGTTAANANNKTIRLKFGSAVLADNAAALPNPNDLDWYIEAYITRRTSITQSSISKASFGKESTLSDNFLLLKGAPSETLTGIVPIVVTGQNGTASSGDITVSTLIVEPVLFDTEHFI